MSINQEQLNALIKAIKESGVFSLASDVDAIAKRMVERAQDAAPSKFSLSQAMRGLMAREGKTVNETTREADLNYLAKALATTATPGSYLVPTIQANDIIQILTTNGILRASGPRIWPMPGIQKLTVPTATGLPTVAYVGQNSASSASDPNLGQVSFDLKTRRALIVVPAELLRVSVPALDAVLAELIATAFAEGEDNAFFSSTTVSGGPQAVLADTNISSIMVGGSANGGNVSYTDLLAVMAKAAAVKAKPPYVWFMSPRTFWQRVFGMIDLQSRPIFIPAYQGLSEVVANAGVASPSGKLLGWPVYVTPFISETETNGSGTNQSHILLTNPKYVHIGEDTGLEIAVSTERYFENNQIGLRGVHRHDFAYGPEAGIVCLKGAN
jgi:HK97 family phage major capsid protein